MTGELSWLGRSLQILVVDLLLAGDNAIAIALVCRSLPQEWLTRASLLGAASAFVPRLLLTGVAARLMEVPGLRLVGAVLLAIIAVNLVAAHGEPGEAGTTERSAAPAASLWAAGMAIAVVNLAMSLDNTVALAAVSQGSMLYLALGLALSIPILMFGNVALVMLFRRHPGLVAAGGAMLGWCAGDMAASDPLVLPWMTAQAPALSVVVPMLVAVYVLVQARFTVATPYSAEPIATRIVSQQPLPPRLNAAAVPAAAPARRPPRAVRRAAAGAAQQPAARRASRKERLVVFGLLSLVVVAGIVLGYVWSIA